MTDIKKTAVAQKSRTHKTNPNIPILNPIHKIIKTQTHGFVKVFSFFRQINEAKIGTFQTNTALT